MKLKLLSAFLIFTMLFSGVQVFAVDNSQVKTQVKTSSISKLSDEELKKCELSGIYKKDWAQRLQWFESKIINHYKSLNKQNILVVGEQKFLDAFKAATERHNWQANFTYATNASKIKTNNNGGRDLVVDAQYNSQHFEKIYGSLKVSSFRKVYSEILYDETLNFLENSGVKYYFFYRPIPDAIKNLTLEDKTFLNDKAFYNNFSEMKEEINQLYKGNDELINFISDGKYKKYHIYNNGKFNVLKDSDLEGFRINNGVRFTSGTNENAKNNIYTFGACIVRGAFVSDNYTIQSILQKTLNSSGFSNFNLVNCGVGCGDDRINDFEYMLSEEYKNGDIVIEIEQTDKTFREVLTRHNKQIYKTIDKFNEPRNYGRWLLNNGFHINHIGNEIIANYIYDVIKPELNNDEPTEPQKTVKYQFENETDTFLDDNPDFKKYLDELKTIKEKNNVNGKIGSIVMNCNPFTLGHRYLIEQAAKQVDHLYIFVVEEDKSVFPFKDRMNLVKEGVVDLGEKITVLPSGKWIISLLTFPEYFNKDDLQGAAIDPSNDIKLFGKYICPALGINQRFVGEEPFDLVTRQYNETMRRELPLLNIDFQEIPRKSVEGEDVISATKVRKALKANDFETLKKYVPQSTLIYLQENYEKIVKAIDGRYNY